MTEWFKDWFESEDYLNLYKHRDDIDARKLFELVLNNVEVNKNKPILDIACGAGRHSVLFAQNGFHVFAFDLSKNLLRIAKRKSIEQNLDIGFFCSDIRNLAINGKFGLVINMFTSFGYFKNDEDNFRILYDVYNYLSDDGYFVLDYFNAIYIKNNLVRNSLNSIDGKEVIQERYIENNRVNKKITIKESSGDKNYMESVRLYEKDEILNIMTRIGFTIYKIFGNYNGDGFDYKESPRLVVIAKK